MEKTVQQHASPNSPLLRGSHAAANDILLLIVGIRVPVVTLCCELNKGGDDTKERVIPRKACSRRVRVVTTCHVNFDD